MSHAVESLVRHCFRGESGRQRDVALAIADGCPDHTGERMFKAIQTIAHLADVGHSTAERAIAHFVKVGWLIKVRAGGYGPRSTTEYRICPEWMRLAGEEIAASLAERRLSRRVPIDTAERFAKIEAAKHPNLGCLESSLSTPVEQPKHPKNEAKHPKNEPKHPSSWGTNYEQRTNTLNNNPLPPKGGEEVEKTEFQKLLASLIDCLRARHGSQAHDESDTTALTRAIAQLPTLRPSQATSETVLRAYRLALENPRWRDGESGERCYRPKLSKWLRGYIDQCRANVSPAHELPAHPAIKTEADKSAEMLAMQAMHSQQSKPPPPEIAEKIAALMGRRRAVPA